MVRYQDELRQGMKEILAGTAAIAETMARMSFAARLQPGYWQCRVVTTGEPAGPRWRGGALASLPPCCRMWMQANTLQNALGRPPCGPHLNAPFFLPSAPASAVPPSCAAHAPPAPPPPCAADELFEIVSSEGRPAEQGPVVARLLEGDSGYLALRRLVLDAFQVPRAA